MDEILDELYPELTLETDDIIMTIAVKKDYSKIKDLDKRKEEFINDPMGCYENKIFCKGAPMKTAVVWNEKYVDFER